MCRERYKAGRCLQEKRRAVYGREIGKVEMVGLVTRKYGRHSGGKKLAEKPEYTIRHKPVAGKRMSKDCSLSIGSLLKNFLIIYFNWSLITLHCCGDFCHTLAWTRGSLKSGLWSWLPHPWEEGNFDPFWSIVPPGGTVVKIHQGSLLLLRFLPCLTWKKMTSCAGNRLD